jgi:hypothetical protein
MSYFDKYLKYKNKYLALKNKVGGKGKKGLTYEYIQNLWVSGKYYKAKVESDSLKKCFNEYCWIGEKETGLGFFIYSIYHNISDAIKESEPLEVALKEPKLSEGINMLITLNQLNYQNDVFKIFYRPTYNSSVIKEYKYEPNFVILRIYRDNIDKILPLTNFRLPKDQIPFETPFDLIEDSNVIIHKGSCYGWNFSLNCFIFKDKNNYYYAHLL